MSGKTVLKLWVKYCVILRFMVEGSKVILYQEHITMGAYVSSLLNSLASPYHSHSQCRCFSESTLDLQNITACSEEPVSALKLILS